MAQWSGSTTHGGHYFPKSIYLCSDLALVSIIPPLVSISTSVVLVWIQNREKYNRKEKLVRQTRMETTCDDTNANLLLAGTVWRGHMGWSAGLGLWGHSFTLFVRWGKRWGEASAEGQHGDNTVVTCALAWMGQRERETQGSWGLPVPWDPYFRYYFRLWQTFLHLRLRTFDFFEIPAWIFLPSVRTAYTSDHCAQIEGFWHYFFQGYIE